MPRRQSSEHAPHRADCNADCSGGCFLERRGWCGHRTRDPACTGASSESIDRAAEMLCSGKRTALLLAGKALYGRRLRIAARVAEATGASLLSPYPFTRMKRGVGVPSVERIAYIQEHGEEHEPIPTIDLSAPDHCRVFRISRQRQRSHAPECEIQYTRGPRPGSDWRIVRAGRFPLSCNLVLRRQYV